MTKVMLVEDDETFRRMLKTLLELEGFQIVYMEDSPGNSILEKIKNGNPDILLLDIHLRDANGIDVVRQIRQDAQIKQLPVLMASGMDMKDQCLQAGANGFLLKPYMPDDLIKWLKTNS
jgi:CheY-like chemotaxis protein